jgi:hypothetical protein
METREELVFRVPATLAPRLQEILEAASTGDVQFTLVEARPLLGAKQSDAIVEIAVTFGIGVASSLVASAIYSLVTTTDLKPTTGNIVVNNTTIIIDSHDTIDHIERGLSKKHKSSAHK